MLKEFTSGIRSKKIRAGLAQLRGRPIDEITVAQRNLLHAYKHVETEFLSGMISVMNASRLPMRVEPQPSKALSAVLIKPVSDNCNLRCTYCYEGSIDNRRLGRRMSSELLQKVIHEVIANSGHTVEFIWHGGEPLLAGIDFYKNVLDLQAHLNINGKVIRNSLQTNGVILSQEWIEFFKAHHFTIGISIDGPKDLHDSMRIYPDGRGSFEDVASNYRALLKSGISCGAILVAGPHHVGRHEDILSIMRTLGIHSFDIHPSCGNGQTNMNDIGPAEYSRLCCALFDSWLLGEEESMSIPFFNDVLRFLAGTQPTTCYFAGKCSSILAIEANGDVVPCTRPFDYSLWTFGNLNNQELRAIINGERYLDFANRDLAAQQRASACSWFGMCHNGCPQHRRDEVGSSIDGVGIYCDCKSSNPRGLPAIFHHIQRRVLEEICL